MKACGHDDNRRGVPLETTTSEILRAAAAGDKLAAKDALSILHWLVSPDNTHPTTGEPLPVPIYVREYLANSLHRMAYGGESGDHAFNLKKSGKQVWSIHDKKLAAGLVQQIILDYSTPEKQMSIDDAAYAAAEAIRESDLTSTNVLESPLAWRSFYTNKPNEVDLRRWYSQFYGKNHVKP
jgi:hypothetical protein